VLGPKWYQLPLIVYAVQYPRRESGAASIGPSGSYSPTASAIQTVTLCRPYLPDAAVGASLACVLQAAAQVHPPVVVHVLAYLLLPHTASSFPEALHTLVARQAQAQSLCGRRPGYVCAPLCPISISAILHTACGGAASTVHTVRVLPHATLLWATTFWAWACRLRSWKSMYFAWVLKHHPHVWLDAS
jgi:hypothetical protein